jgi:hypothetical protein
VNTGPDSPALKPGTYFTAIAHYHDGSAILGAYGLCGTKTGAEGQAKRLREAGIYPNETWTIVPLRIIDLGPQP